MNSDQWSPFPDKVYSDYAFLAGSGISVPSGLPSGWGFNREIARFLAATPGEAEELLSLLSVGYGQASHVVRFEQLMYVLRERVDPDLRVPSCFDGGCPSGFHFFLAKALRHGAHVLTTNFDCLIEMAFGDLELESTSSRELFQIIFECEEDDPKKLSCRSFEAYLRCGLPQPAVLKLHGTIRAIRADEEGFENLGASQVGATLDRIGTRGGAMRLEPHKHETLQRVLQGRVLCVLGYSGADDFDVVPSLAEALPKHAGLMWFRHENLAPEIQDAHSPEGAELLPESVRTAAKQIRSFVVRGLTDQAVAELFGFSSSAWARVQPAPIEPLLMTLPPYRSLGPAHRKIVSARLAEEALRFETSLLRYDEALKLSRRCNPPLYAYALFRSGHVKRTIGDDVEARLRLTRAVRNFRRQNDQPNVALALNALGNLFLVRGALRQAEKYYRASLAGAVDVGNRRLEATVLNNIGLIWKKRGELEWAVDWYDRAAAIDSDIRDRSGLARELGNKINALILLKRYEEALMTFEQTADIQRLLGRLDLLANSLVARGIALCHLGRVDESEQEAYMALEIEKDLGRKEGIAGCNSLLGQIAEARGKSNEAIARYAEATSLERAIHRPEALAVDLENTGMCYATVGEHGKAADAFREASLLYSDLGNTRKAAELGTKETESRLHTASAAVPDRASD